MRKEYFWKKFGKIWKKFYFVKFKFYFILFFAIKHFEFITKIIT